MTAELPDVHLSPGGPFGIYVHVPFCITRCGYCDFNTYTPAELGGVNPDAWLLVLRTGTRIGGCAAGRTDRADRVRRGWDAVAAGRGATGCCAAVGARQFRTGRRCRGHDRSQPRIDRGRRCSRRCDRPGSTEGVAGHAVGVAAGAGHPRPCALAGSLGGRRRRGVAAGFEHVSLDLIYGTPGETDDDVLRSVDAAVDTGVDHVSAYALVVEDGTALARRVRRGELAAPDDDVLAHRYELVDEQLSAAGFEWYEVSNWSRPGGQCRHNIGYWDGGQWWGAGPGAHSYVGSTRWWNVKHPNAYAQMLWRPRRCRSPVSSSSMRGTATPRTCCCGSGFARVCRWTCSMTRERERAAVAVEDGLLIPEGERLVLTDRGRLLADGVVRTLLG